jgi:hypothetical protein
MSHLNKVILALLCAGALFYFDSREKTHVGNNNKFRANSDISIRLGNSSLRSICFLASKRKQTRVICPDCKKWVRDVGAKTYSCANSKIKRGLLFTHRGRK